MSNGELKLRKKPVRIAIIGAGAVSDYHHVPGIELDSLGVRFRDPGAKGGHPQLPAWTESSAGGGLPSNVGGLKIQWICKVV